MWKFPTTNLPWFILRIKWAFIWPHSALWLIPFRWLLNVWRQPKAKCNSSNMEVLSKCMFLVNFLNGYIFTACDFFLWWCKSKLAFCVRSVWQTLFNCKHFLCAFVRCQKHDFVIIIYFFTPHFQVKCGLKCTKGKLSGVDLKAMFNVYVHHVHS